MPATLPTVSFYAGDTFERELTFLRDGVARNLITEGWEDWSVMWRKTRNSTAYIAATVDTSRANVGIILIKFSSVQTRAMAGDGVWDMQAHRDGETYTWWTGSTSWLVDVTRPD